MSWGQTWPPPTSAHRTTQVFLPDCKNVAQPVRGEMSAPPKRSGSNRFSIVDRARRSFSPLGKSLGATLHRLLFKVCRGHEVTETGWVSTELDRPELTWHPVTLH